MWSTTPQQHVHDHEELLLTPEELNRIWILRKVLSDLTPVEAMELMQERLQATRSNREFLQALNS